MRQSEKSLEQLNYEMHLIEFTKAAMQGILSNPKLSDVELHDSPQEWVEDIIGQAKDFAEAQLKKLGITITQTANANNQD